MSWTGISNVSTTYSEELSDTENGYVLSGYVIDGYIDARDAWTVTASVSDSWTVGASASGGWTSVANVSTTWA